MFFINEREVYLQAGANSFADFDDMFAEAFIERAEWADTGKEFTEAEYAEHEEFLNSVEAGELYWDQMV